MSKYLKTIAVVCKDSYDYLEWTKEFLKPGDKEVTIPGPGRINIDGKIYAGVYRVIHLCSISPHDVIYTPNSYDNPEYNDIIKTIECNRNSQYTMKTKPSAEEFLKSKGWAEESPIIGGSLFKSISGLLEEYAKLKPYDPNDPRFPSESEIDGFADLYPKGEIYVYAGINLVKEWLKKHGLL